jgi:hypothetical protein
MTYGFVAQSEGLLIYNTFYQASQFALAYLTVTPHKKELLHSILSRIKETPAQTTTPLLKQLSNEPRSLEIYESFIHKAFGTTKSTFDSLIIPKTDTTLCTISRQHQTTLTIASRRLGQKQRPTDITIKNPLYTSLDELTQLSFEGNDQSEQQLSQRADPFSPGLSCDASFLRQISYRDLFAPVQIVGHKRASALLALSQGLKEQTVKWATNRPLQGDVFIPFDFSKVPELAFEISLRRFAPSWFLQAVLGTASNSVLDADKFLHEKQGFQTTHYNVAMRSGVGSVATLINRRNLCDGGNYLLYALVDHNITERSRIYKGMTTLFSNTNQAICAVKFVDTNKNMEAYIASAPHLPGPVIIYMNYESPFAQKVTDIKRLQEPLIDLVNQAHTTTPKRFGMTDRLGRFAVCSIFTPDDHIFEKASHYSRLAKTAYTSASLKSYYIDRMRTAKKHYGG